MQSYAACQRAHCSKKLTLILDQGEQRHIGKEEQHTVSI